MKWILLWTIVTAQGGVSSGSEPFDSLEACFAAQKVMGGITIDAASEFSVRKSIESACLNSATGDRKTVISPRKGL